MTAKVIISPSSEKSSVYYGINMDIQVFATDLLTRLAGVMQVGYAFGAGMVSAVNPCGFAMLPVYLSLYLGADDEQFDNRSLGFRLFRAIGVALVVTAGFGLLFGSIGLLVSIGGSFLMGVVPWVSVIVGFGLILLGILLLLGRHLSFSFFMELGSRIGDPRTISIKGFFLFGMAFGATSLSCTLPIFLVVVGGALASGDVLVGMLQFLWYILGTGSVLLILTAGMALVKGGVVIGAVRKLMPYVNKISAVLLILAGGYIIYYWFSSGLLFQ